MYNQNPYTGYRLDNKIPVVSPPPPPPSGLRLAGALVPGACFSKVPKLFGRILGDIILFVSSN